MFLNKINIRKSVDNVILYWEKS